MTTTTVVDSELQLTVKDSDWLPPAETHELQSMNSFLDKFPPLGDEVYDTQTNLGTASKSFTRNPHHDIWQPRRAEHRMWERANGSVVGSRHKPSKSISEAITTIRTRNASVSANAQELAQALKAPVSYRLIVRDCTSLKLSWITC